jgi:gluconokinase
LRLPQAGAWGHRAFKAMNSATPLQRRLPLVILLMGVAGSGKTTIGLQLAQELGWSFRDADDFHPPENVAKMSAGMPLDDHDRAPWLAAIRSHIGSCLARGESAIVTCSALKERYRAIVAGDPRVQLVHLTGDFDLILERMNKRQGHFMKPEMLRSQFAALEPPSGAVPIDIDRPPAEIVAAIRQKLSL